MTASAVEWKPAKLSLDPPDALCAIAGDLRIVKHQLGRAEEWTEDEAVFWLTLQVIDYENPESRGWGGWWRRSASVGRISYGDATKQMTIGHYATWTGDAGPINPPWGKTPADALRIALDALKADEDRGALWRPRILKALEAA